MTEKVQKIAKNGIKMAKMIINVHLSKPFFLVTIEEIFCRKICKFRGLLLDFGKNLSFFGKSPVSRLFLACLRAPRARAHDISANIDPISLKFEG